MAVGDIINVQMASSTSYQPAAGVEIVVIKVFVGSPGSLEYGLSDGTSNYCKNYHAFNGGTPGYDSPSFGNKYGITNTLYMLNTSSQTNNRGFSGIQIK